MDKRAKVLKENTVLSLTQDKWDRLRELCSNDGMVPSMSQDTGLPTTTIFNVLKNGRGQIRVLTKILDFMIKAEKDIENILSND